MLNLENLKKFYLNDFGEKKIIFDNLFRENFGTENIYFSDAYILIRKK